MELLAPLQLSGCMGWSLLSQGVCVGGLPPPLLMVQALSAEVAALTAALKDKDAAVAYWLSEAEQRSRLAEVG